LIFNVLACFGWFDVATQIFFFKSHPFLEIEVQNIENQSVKTCCAAPLHWRGWGVANRPIRQSFNPSIA